jgi:hypothetical protein
MNIYSDPGTWAPPRAAQSGPAHLAMFHLAALTSCAVEPSYSIYAPFRYTDPGEVGNWSLRGSAIPMRHFIRLTPALPNMTGAVCSLIPTNFRDWNLTVRLSAFGGLGGIGFRIIFSSRVCRASSDGFTVWITRGRRTSTTSTRRCI